LGVGFVDNEENRRRFKLDAEKARLFAKMLYIGEEPCAFYVGFIHRDTLYPFFTGYDPNYSKYEVGTIAFLKMVEDLINRNLGMVDFGFGDAFYKQQFADEFYQETAMYIFSSTLRGFWIKMGRTSIFLCKSLALSFLSKFGIVQEVRKRWRKRKLSKMRNP
jgi:CelD/BcsL family acetyltransferase involved in cellulose biosynthesis